MGLIKHNCSSGFPAQTLHSIRNTGRPRRTQHHISTAAKAFDASSPSKQTRSIVNTGRLRRTAARLINKPVPIVRRKEVADSRLSPGSKCRAERNRTGHRSGSATNKSNFKECSLAVLPLVSCRRAAWWVIVRLSAAFHPAKRHGEQNTERPRNADGERRFLSNTAGAGRAHGGAVL